MKTRFYLLLSLLLIFASCKKDIVVPAHLLPSHRSLLVFMGGDNNLHKETYEKVEALRKGYKTGMGRLLIFQVAKGASPRLIEIKAAADGIGQVHELKTYQNNNAAHAAVFKEVLHDLVAQAPSESYGLLLFSHGSGWLPQSSLLNPYASAVDEGQDMNLREFAAAIPDHFFDFMIFESCFMSGIEVMYELKDKTDYIVSSSAEILSPGFTPIYGDLLPDLYQPEAQLKSFAKRYFDHYNQQSGTMRAATVSVTATSQLEALAIWAKKYATLSLPSDQLPGLQHFDRYTTYSLFFDFEEYYRNISSPDSQGEFAVLLNKAVVFKAATPKFLVAFNGFEIKLFSGLTSYIPQNDFTYLNTEYKKLKWSTAISE